MLQESQNEKRDVFISTASQIIVRFFTLAFTLIAVKLTTTHLGTVGTGEYNTIQTYINFFIVIADLGLFSVTVREIAKAPEKQKKILANVLYLRIVTALIASTVAALVVFSTRYGIHIKVGVLIATGFLFFNLVSSVYDMVLQNKLKMQFSALAEFLSRLITLVALFVIVRYGSNFYLIVATIPLSGFLFYLLKQQFAKRYAIFSPLYNAEISRWIISIAWPLGIVFIVGNLFFKLDTLMLFVIKGAAAVGIYSVAYKVLEVVIFVGSYFANSLKPIFSREINGGNKARIGNIASRAMLIMLIMALPISIVSFLYARDIIIFLSNEQFAGGAKALMIIAFVLPFMFWDMLLREIFIANDERKLLINTSIFALLFNFVLNLIFIPKYSYIGAAGTTLGSEILLFAINLYYTRNIIPCTIKVLDLLKLAAITFLTVILSVLIKKTGINFIIQIALLTLWYAALLQIFSIAKIKTVRALFKA